MISGGRAARHALHVEAEARATIGDEALDAALADVGAKGRTSPERYRAAGHSIADQA